MKNRISSMFTSPGNLTPSLDLYKQELQTEMSKVERELTQEFFSSFRHKSTGTDLDSTSTNFLKSSLNHLISANHKKSSQLLHLKSLVELKNKSKANSVSNKELESSVKKILKLQNFLKKIEDQLKSEFSEQETLQEMKSQEVHNLMNFKEKLDNLNKIYKNKEVDSQKKLNKKIQRKFENIESQQELKSTKNLILKSQIKREASLDILRNTKIQQEKAIRQSIYNLSEANLRQRENNTRKIENKELIEDTLIESSQNFNIREYSKNKLAEIRMNLNIIKKNIRDCPNFSEPLSSENTKFIVDAYSKLKFQEQSLSVNFQNLTEEQMDKQLKCEKIREELSILKSNELNFLPKFSNKMTFNQLKLSLDNKEGYENSKSFTQVQQTLIQLHLKILSFSVKIKKNLENIFNQTKALGKPDDLVAALDRLENPNTLRTTQEIKDVFSRRKSVTLVDNRRGKPFLMAEKVFKQTISQAKIKELLLKNYEYIVKYKGNERLSIDEIAKMIASDTIVCFFIEINGIDSKMIAFLNSPKQMIVALNKIACDNFKNQTFRVSSSILDILNLLNHKITLGKEEILQFYSEKSPENLPEIRRFLQEGDLTVNFEFFDKIRIKKEVKLNEDQGLRVITEGNYIEKSTKSSIHTPQLGKLPKSSKNTFKISSFDFKVHSTPNKHLRVSDPDRFSLRCSPSSTNLAKDLDRFVNK